jgi:hypothetical protein
MFRQCGICRPPINLSSVQSYVNHCTLHKNVPNVQFKCCYTRCAVKVRSVSSLRMHIARNHVQQYYGNQKRTMTCST